MESAPISLDFAARACNIVILPIGSVSIRIIVGHSADLADATLTEHFAAIIAHFPRKPNDTEADRADAVLDQFLLRLILVTSVVDVDANLVELPVKVVLEVLLDPLFDGLLVDTVELVEELLVFEIYYPRNRISVLLLHFNF